MFLFLELSDRLLLGLLILGMFSLKSCQLHLIVDSSIQVISYLVPKLVASELLSGSESIVLRLGLSIFVSDLLLLIEFLDVFLFDHR